MADAPHYSSRKYYYVLLKSGYSTWDKPTLATADGGSVSSTPAQTTDPYPRPEEGERGVGKDGEYSQDRSAFSVRIGPRNKEDRRKILLLSSFVYGSVLTCEWLCREWQPNSSSASMVSNPVMDPHPHSVSHHRCWAAAARTVAARMVRALAMATAVVVLVD